MPRKGLYKGYSKEMGVYSMRYAEKFQFLKVRIPNDEADRIKAICAAAGSSFSSFALDALREKIDRDGLDQKPDPAT